MTGHRNGFFGPRVAVNAGPAKVPIAAEIAMATAWAKGPLRRIFLKYPMDVSGPAPAGRIVVPGRLSLVLEGNLIGGEKS